MNLILNFQILISGIIIGIIFFQTALAAPIVFNNLNKSQSRIYIRNIFPKIFKTNMCLSLTLLMVNVVFHAAGKVHRRGCIALRNKRSFYSFFIA